MKLRVQIENISYEVEVGDLTQRPILAVVDGETFEVYPEELQTPAAAAPVGAPSPLPRPSMPAPKPAAAPVKAPSSSAAGGNTITAPIPGVILSVSVKVGDDIVPEQEICVLEAMKMKNTIRADRAGKISAVYVSNGDTVKHGQPIVDF